MATYLTGQQRTFTVPITAPTGHTIAAYVYVSTDSAGTQGVISGSPVSLGSSGGAVSYALPINITVANTYYTFVAYSIDGAAYVAVPQSAQITEGTVSVGQGVWS